MISISTHRLFFSAGVVLLVPSRCIQLSGLRFGVRAKRVFQMLGSQM